MRSDAEPRRGEITIDILVLVDRLEDLFRNGARIPLTRKRIVDQQAFLDIIDQMRIAIPEEIRQAKRLNDDSERVRGNAQSEAERILAETQKHAAMLLSQQGIMQAAEEQSDQIAAHAVAHRAHLIAEADEHCIAVLTALEDELNELLSSTRNGIQHLQAKTAESEGIESGEKGS